MITIDSFYLKNESRDKKKKLNNGHLAFVINYLQYQSDAFQKTYRTQILPKLPFYVINYFQTDALLTLRKMELVRSFIGLFKKDLKRVVLQKAPIKE